MTNSSPLFTSPSSMPRESAFSRRVTLTQTQSPAGRKVRPPWLSQWPRPTLTPSSPPSTCSLGTEGLNRCSPPPETPSVRSAGSSATSPTAVPANYLFAPTARLPIPKRSIAALTLPALRVAISDLSSPAVHPRWHAALTAKKSTLRAAGIAPPAQKPPQILQRCDLDRGRTAWISLETRRPLRRSLIQHQMPLLTPQRPLYSPAMLLHLGREPNAPSPSPTLPQEKAVMNPSTMTPPRALPNNGEFFHAIHGQRGCLPVLSNRST